MAMIRSSVIARGSSPAQLVAKPLPADPRTEKLVFTVPPGYKAIIRDADYFADTADSSHWVIMLFKWSGGNYAYAAGTAFGADSGASVHGVDHVLEQGDTLSLVYSTPTSLMYYISGALLYGA